METQAWPRRGERHDGMRIPSGCAVAGVASTGGRPISGDTVVCMVCAMPERTNGLGAGYAAYGIYPDLADCYAFHLMYEDARARASVEELLHAGFQVEVAEPIPTRPRVLVGAPMLWRYFLRVPEQVARSWEESHAEPRGDGPPGEDDYVVRTVMDINTGIPGAFVFSSGRNMGVFKAVGHPEAVADFFMLDQYRGHSWLGHSRFPTNTPGWWGGAHPFLLLDWSVVHNGELSSYGTNRRYVESFGYRCTLLTDTEVIVYLVDLLVRRQGLPLQAACRILTPPFWRDLDGMGEEAARLRTARIIYGGALLNGPFTTILGHSRGLVGLTDRLMLRPLVAATRGDLFYLASEEAAIRAVCSGPDRVWSPPAGEPVPVEVGLSQVAVSAEVARS
ncbi:MAG: glutamine amidotransferase family protein [Bacillota bacterium]|nr:glutamine amidotransferase family protein [Bacillota bacterium]MDI7250241.1 glutamine amidotransferase family protein [Bacillota bacterium]